jgi:hypothetical protein
MSETIKFIAAVVRLPTDEPITEATRQSLIELGQRAKHEHDSLTATLSATRAERDEARRERDLLREQLLTRAVGVYAADALARTRHEAKAEAVEEAAKVCDAEDRASTEFAKTTTSERAAKTARVEAATCRILADRIRSLVQP